MLHNWAELYSSQLTSGENWNVLKPVISIWLVCEPVFLDFTGFHCHFSFCDQINNLCLAEHAKIHVIELSKWNKSQVENDLDIWAHFFKEGKTFSQDGLPEDMLTQEMEEAMTVLKQFSEKERDYDRYRLRVEYLREQSTLKEDREIARAELEEAKKELEYTKKEVEQSKKEVEQSKKEVEQSKKEVEQSKKESEQFKMELIQERLSSDEKEQALVENEQALVQAQLEIEKLKQ